MRNAARQLALVAALTSLSSCSRPIRTARMGYREPPTDVELQARAQYQGRACSPYFALVFPGLGHACLKKPGHALTFGTLAAAEIAGAVYASEETGVDPLSPEPDDNPAPLYFLVAVQDLWVYSMADALFTAQMANGLAYVPQDSPVDLLAAPFNIEVMKKPAVWLGLAGALAVGIGASLLVDESSNTDNFGEDPNLFGKDVDGRWGYPAGLGVGIGLFTHVAVAEEALFRGFLQSAMTRAWGAKPGWIASSLIFGAVHALNLPAIDEEDRTEYLAIGLPVITAAGFYLGWLYENEQYSLAAPVAVHFWYDLLLTTTFFVLDPKNSPFSASISFPF